MASTVLKITKTQFNVRGAILDGYQVNSINGIDIKSRGIYLTLNSYSNIKDIYYTIGQSEAKAIYVKASDDAWKIQINGKKYFIFYRSVILEEEEDNTNHIFNTFNLEVKKYYRTLNGYKVKIVADVSNEFYTDRTRFIGVYERDNGKAASIRYSEKGNVLSHGGDHNYDIVDEWKEKSKVWIVIYNSNQCEGSIASMLCHTLQQAKDYEFKFKMKNTFIKTVEIDLK